MSNNQDIQAIKEHWDRDGLTLAIRNVLINSDKPLDTLTIDDLAPLDQFHRGSKGFTSRLAHLAGLKAGMKILDLGGGVGGPARTLAVEFGCHVTVIDIAESYVLAGRMLTNLMHLNDHITHQVGNALEIPFEDHSFDAAWTQNSGMNIKDKKRLYAEIHRVIRPNGLFATQEPVTGLNQPLIFPVMWSRDGIGNFLYNPAELHALIEATGFQTLTWHDVTQEKSAAPGATTIHSIQSLVMGAELLAEIRKADKRNDEEGRVGMIQAVFQRVEKKI